MYDLVVALHPPASFILSHFAPMLYSVAKYHIQFLRYELFVKINS